KSAREANADILSSIGGARKAPALLGAMRTSRLYSLRVISACPGKVGAGLPMRTCATLKVRLVGSRGREEIITKAILIVLGANRLQERVGHLAPAQRHVQRLIERVRIGDFHEYFKIAAVVGGLEALDHVQLFGLRRALEVDVALVGGEPDPVADQPI